MRRRQKCNSEKRCILHWYCDNYLILWFCDQLTNLRKIAGSRFSVGCILWTELEQIWFLIYVFTCYMASLLRTFPSAFVERLTLKHAAVSLHPSPTRWSMAWPMAWKSLLAAIRNVPSLITLRRVLKIFLCRSSCVDFWVELTLIITFPIHYHCNSAEPYSTCRASLTTTFLQTTTVHVVTHQDITVPILVKWQNICSFTIYMSLSGSVSNFPLVIKWFTVHSYIFPRTFLERKGCLHHHFLTRHCILSCPRQLSCRWPCISCQYHRLVSLCTQQFSVCCPSTLCNKS